MPTRADMMNEMDKMDLTPKAPQDHDEYLASIRRQNDAPPVHEPGMGEQLHQAYGAVRDYVKRKTGY